MLGPDAAATRRKRWIVDRVEADFASSSS